MKINIAKAEIRKILKNRINCNFEINLIFSHVLKISTTQLLLTNEISNEHFNKILKMAKKLSKNKPLQQLLLKWQFYNVEIFLNKKVLIPRPETEMLVNFALSFKNKKIHILDLCTGSGCISAAIAKNNKQAKIKSIDISPFAIKCAKKNTAAFKNRIKIVKGSVFQKNLIKNFNNWANLIVCNPPYLTSKDMKNLQKEVSFEPKIALFGGNDGLIFYKKICKLWKKALKSSGWIAFEIGTTQKNSVESILKQNKFTKIKTLIDPFGNNRLTVAQKVEF